MTKDESLALLAEGRDAWNAWAKALLAERKRLEDSGDWDTAQDDWEDRARVDFEGHEFKEDVSFNAFVFPGDAWFDSVTFSGDAWFSGATFSGDAWFGDAKFSEDTMFNGATFAGEARFDAVTFWGDAEFERATYAGVAWFGATWFTGNARFDGATFSGEVGVPNATFSGYAGFEGARFSGYAMFTGTKFNDNAGFNGATFSGNARFNGATFSGAARFERTTFSGGAGFGGATFSGEARFRQAKFTGYSTFQKARFSGEATFAAMEGKTAFSLEAVVFERVTDFNQAHFDEAPRLDSVRIEPGGFVEKYHEVKRQSAEKDPWEHAPDFFLRALAGSFRQHWGWSGDANRAARWRSLKRLAIQGHDHAREQEYFRGELLARRWHEDKPWHGSFWVGLLYQLLGSFGASVVRPILWWLISTAGFAVGYLAIHLERASPLAPTGSSLRVAARALWDWAFTASPSLPCAIGPGDPAAAALGLSVSKGLFAGIGSATKLNQIHTCLYGVQSQVPGSLTPVIPDLVTGLGVLQFLLSAALIFLFGLALRNYFRIK